MVSIYLITLLINTTPEEWSKSVWGEPPVKLEARINNPKSYYYSHEPIWLEWWFYNVSKETLKVWLPYSGSFGKSILKIEGEKDGKRFAPQFRISTTWGVKDWEKQGGELLPPGDTLHQIIDLSYWFVDFPQGGRFHLTNLVYTNTMVGVLHFKPRPLHKPFWWGSVKAPLNFDFIVKPPEGKDKEALSLLKKAKTLDEYIEILHRYPNSYYVYFVFEDKIRFIVEEDLKEKRYEKYSKLLKEVEWYIENFKTPEHKFPEVYWDEYKWIEKRDKLMMGIKEYKERNEK